MLICHILLTAIFGGVLGYLFRLDTWAFWVLMIIFIINSVVCRSI